MEKENLLEAVSLNDVDATDTKFAIDSGRDIRDFEIPPTAACLRILSEVIRGARVDPPMWERELSEGAGHWRSSWAEALFQRNCRFIVPSRPYSAISKPRTCHRARDSAFVCTYTRARY